MTQDQETTKTSDIIKDLVEQIAVCIDQFPKPDSGADTITSLNWQPFRILQNNMYDILSCQSIGQAVPVASILINSINSVFSDLCTNTPWDKEGVVNLARVETQKELLQMLEYFNNALLEQKEKQDEMLWNAYRNFETNYNRIIQRVNHWDKDLLNNNVVNLE